MRGPARRHLAGAVLSTAALTLCLAACAAEGPANNEVAADAFEIYPDPPISTPGMNEGMRTLLLESVQRGSKTLSPIQVKARRKLGLTATCLGEGTFTFSLVAHADDPNYLSHGHLGLDFDCDRDRAAPNGYEGPVHADAAYTPQVSVQGDVEWFLRIEQQAGS
ncbi:hypothetical protein [Actinocorallia aurantiaca]|uniref:Lipoprotein n=1 Tax=Actinocorallia aurantiaca TaxID=46204 RepID=A0ABN3UUU7_9ACTN